MSEPAPVSAPRFFQPVTLLAGIVLGLCALSWAGRAVIQRDWHRDFVRFHPLISGETQYQPTVGEMRAIVRARCRPDQILVIVGGNSIFQGVGQPVEKLWSRRLQELLGDRYAVVNLAFRGSSPTDGGALVAESLRAEFPRQIYLANVPPFTGADAAGSQDFFFVMTMDAYHKGWLLDFPPRTEVIADRLARPDIYPGVGEQVLGGRLDAWLRFRDLWNWWSATRCFTFPTPLTPGFPGAFRPRNDFTDHEPDFEDMPFAQRFAPRFAEAEMQITSNTSSRLYRHDRNGKWVPHLESFRAFRKIAAGAFPPSLKARTLIILSRNSPFYTKKLTEPERERDELSFRDGIVEWQKQGYAAMEYGPDFSEQDFGDRTHLTATGGHKLADRVAPEIRALATRLGYPNP